MTIAVDLGCKATKQTKLLDYHWEEHGGSVVECLTRDLGVAGSSLTGDTTMCP